MRLHHQTLVRLYIIAYCALLLITVFSSQVIAQTIRNTNDNKSSHARVAPPFAPNEQLIYEATYTKLLLRGINIAELKFNATSQTSTTEAKTEDTRANDSSKQIAPMTFTSDITSQGFFVKLFGVNFKYHFASIVDAEKFATIRTIEATEQSKRKRESEAVFDRKEKRVTWTERDPNDAKKPPRIVTGALEDSKDTTTNDLLTAIYFLRTQPLALNKTFEMSVSHNGRVHKIPVKVAERARMQTALGKVAVWRLEVDVFGANRLVEGNGSMFIWLTDDARRLPVRARFNNDSGTLELTLKRVDGSATPNAKVQLKRS